MAMAPTNPKDIVVAIGLAIKSKSSTANRMHNWHSRNTSAFPDPGFVTAMLHARVERMKVRLSVAWLKKSATRASFDAKITIAFIPAGSAMVTM